ncbi:hypothetical protein A2801_03200 [Candidatus Woesebacteria bacterium RIFCSPHIGHO2_01_FULL_41_10]|uniref:Inositol-phosphate phosphatase n=1 Tax=Candidatus Woesebacteria bacterium RIFCSPHIGHO2_01_FULL_41_10 TaxID=1802500 RepID=A0A1F7YSR6_9BACT|nr:MAG: hypothetical protein A2801_03200 [Candidatus Woesebacteria bacterium RIFCSPHIGHO2_01_FULL_41_10]
MSIPQNRVKLMRDLARKAGQAIVDPKLLQMKTLKVGNQDLLTLGDLESERIIVGSIKENFPEDKIMAEEGSPEEQTKGFDGFVWVVDPIDATVNYARGRNNSAVSIGIVQNDNPVAGAIYNPYLNELFWAIKGKGAYLNEDCIHVSSIDTFSKALCLTDNGAEGKDTRRNLQLLLDIPEFERIVITGSATLHFTEIASGRADFYLHTYLKPWDNAAGFVLVTEAGGTLRTLQNQVPSIYSSEVVTGNSKIVSEYFRTREKVC